MQINLDRQVARTRENLQEFRVALGQFVTGITIVTCCDNGFPKGITANSFASVSLDPPLVLWSPAKASRRYDAFIIAQNYSIHILSNEQKHICDVFSDNSSPFDELDWKFNEYGVPILGNYLARLDCHLHAQYPGGDHTIIVGHVDYFDYKVGEPLVFKKGNFSSIAVQKTPANRSVATEKISTI